MTHARHDFSAKNPEVDSSAKNRNSRLTAEFSQKIRGLRFFAEEAALSGRAS